MFSGKMCTEECIAVGARRRGDGAGLHLSWTDHGVKWYADTKTGQLNDTNIYHYVVLGYDKAAEEA